MRVELPDFDEMMQLSDEIYVLSIEKNLLELRLKTQEADTVREVSTNHAYFTNGKASSQAYIDNTWKITGLNGELIPMRERLAVLSAEIDKKKSRFFLMRDFIGVWRTQEANERNSIV